jgi:hypothetical protein
LKRTRLAAAAVLAVFASVLLAGLYAGAARIHSSLSVPPERLFSEELLKTAEQADRLLPAEAPVFYVCSDADTWNCGLWQRLLYPRPVFCLRTSNPHHAEISRDLETRFHIRHAIGSADPPPELSVAKRTEVSSSCWVGELSP